MNRRPSPLLTIGITAVVTAAATMFARNFVGGEKKIKRRIAQRYGISDPQFERAMSQLLGPPIVGGNLVRPLRNGVEIFPAMLDAIERAERSITFETFMYRCKTMIIDELWVSVGSANFDNRSFRLNDEANLNIIGQDIAAAETRAFDQDVERSREVTYEQWRRRPAWQRATDATSAVFRSQL